METTSNNKKYVDGFNQTDGNPDRVRIVDFIEGIKNELKNVNVDDIMNEINKMNEMNEMYQAKNGLNGLGLNCGGLNCGGLNGGGLRGREVNGKKEGDGAKIFIGGMGLNGLNRWELNGMRGCGNLQKMMGAIGFTSLPAILSYFIMNSFCIFILACVLGYVVYLKLQNTCDNDNCRFSCEKDISSQLKSDAIGFVRKMVSYFLKKSVECIKQLSNIVKICYDVYNKTVEEILTNIDKECVEGECVEEEL